AGSARSAPAIEGAPRPTTRPHVCSQPSRLKTLLDPDEDRRPLDHFEPANCGERTLQVFLARLVRTHDDRHGGLDSTALLNHRHDRNPVAPEHRCDRTE